MSGSSGVFDGLTSGFVNQSKAGKPIFILHSCAVLLIFVPVLKSIKLAFIKQQIEKRRELEINIVVKKPDQNKLNITVQLQ